LRCGNFSPWYIGKWSLPSDEEGSVLSQSAPHQWHFPARLANSRSRRSRSPRTELFRRLTVERLEERCLLAADLPFAGTTFDDIGLLDISHSEAIAVACLPVVEDAPPAVADAASAVAAAPFTLDQTFLLHSNPGASKVIYLDFDGHTTTGTQWNTSYTSGAPIVTPAYSFEGSSSFSNNELERIQYIWQRISEDFIPFNVDVTTQDPGVEALRNTGGGDTQWGVRVAIGGSSSDWYGSSAGGVAYVGSFDWSSDTPCFVFEEQLSNGNEKYTAEAASHEAGHTLGLSHDGTNSVSYYEGHGSGATGWAPIMGVGYYQALSQWSKGEYPGANQSQDDLSIITTSNGFGYRADDHGGTRAAATSLNISATVVSNTGLIERTSDVDYFVFSTGGSTINLDIDPFSRSPNLDILATLYNSSGGVIATSNPTTALDASFSLAVGPGTYYLSVDGTGKPANGSDYGYTEYGSLGYYTITGTIVETVTPGIDLYGNGFTVTPTSLLVSGGIVNAELTIENRGDTTAPTFNARFYLSDDPTIDPTGDLLLTLDPGSAFFDALDPTAYHVPDGLATLGTHAATVPLVVPFSDPFGTDNQYYLGMYVDADGTIAEADESNNRNRGDGLDRQAVSYSGTISNAASITVPGSGAASPYPSSIVVANLSGKVTDVNVSLLGVSHTFPDDLDVLLVGPGGQTVLLMSDVGGVSDANGVNLVLDDEAVNSLPNSSQLASGSFKPTNVQGNDTFASPAPAGPYGSLLSVFHDTNPNGTWNLYVTDDSGFNSGSIAGGWGLTFTLANTAPTNPANVALPAIIEDIAAAANTGVSVASIVSASGSTDVDGNLLGIAVTGADNTFGQWQYSVSGGGAWQDIAAVSPTAARLLAPSNYLRFVPNLDFNSQIASPPGLDFKVWDETFGAIGGTADTTASNAFSTNTAVASQPITAVNDPPSFALTSTLVTVDQDSGASTVIAFATSIVPGPPTATDEAGQALAFTVMVAGTTGTLSFDSGPSMDATSGTLSFAAAPNTAGTATVDVWLQDDGGSVSPNVNESPHSQFTIVVTAVNHEQILAVNAGLTVEQADGATITTAILETTDIDNSPAQLLYAVTAGPAHGTLLVDGIPATLFTQAQINAGAVFYQNDGSLAATDNFDFTVDDGAGTASVGAFNIVIRSRPGDYNRDLSVDAADYIFWRMTAGTTGITPYSGADGSGDGTIDQGDYDVWRMHFGDVFTPAPGSSASADGGAESSRSAEVRAGSEEGENSRLAAAGHGVTNEVAMVERQAQPDLPAYLSSGVSRALGGPRISRLSFAEVNDHDDAIIAWIASRSGEQRRYDEGAIYTVDASESGDNSPDSLCENVDEFFGSFAAPG
jgi:subtilisin-like proprotein convertase family protein